MGGDMDTDVAKRIGTSLATGPGVPPTSTAIANPLFWSFPMQGRPILPEDRMLEEAGVALL